MSTMVPAKPPGPVIVNVVKGPLGFEIVNIPPPSLVPGRLGQEIDVIIFPLIVAQQ
jgi:hypothetical protein